MSTMKGTAHIKLGVYLSQHAVATELAIDSQQSSHLFKISLTIEIIIMKMMNSYDVEEVTFLKLFT